MQSLSGNNQKGFGAWRSLVSALVWGTRGRWFKSSRPDCSEPGETRAFSFCAADAGSSSVGRMSRFAGCPPRARVYSHASASSLGEIVGRRPDRCDVGQAPDLPSQVVGVEVGVDNGGVHVRVPEQLQRPGVFAGQDEARRERVTQRVPRPSRLVVARGDQDRGGLEHVLRLEHVEAPAPAVIAHGHDRGARPSRGSLGATLRSPANTASEFATGKKRASKLAFGSATWVSAGAMMHPTSEWRK